MPAARGGGLGAWVWERVEEEARAAGCDRVGLAVVAANPRALAFWQRRGFVEERVTEPLRSGRVVQRRHVLGKDLRA